MQGRNPCNLAVYAFSALTAPPPSPPPPPPPRPGPPRLGLSVGRISVVDGASISTLQATPHPIHPPPFRIRVQLLPITPSTHPSVRSSGHISRSHSNVVTCARGLSWKVASEGRLAYPQQRCTSHSYSQDCAALRPVRFSTSRNLQRTSRCLGIFDDQFLS